MIRIVVGILFLLHAHFLIAQYTHSIISGDTIYSYSDKDFEIIKAASEGDTAKLLAFLEIGADVNITTYEGVTPLMFAAQNGHLRVVEILIDSGAKVNLKPDNKIDALLGACIAGHVVVADTLILNGARVNTFNQNGVNPLMYAAAFNYPVMVDMLLFYKAKINSEDYFGNTALHLSTFYNNLEVSEQLIGNFADMDIGDNNGFTPIIIAAQNGTLEQLEFLWESGADIEKTNNYNLDALSLAIIAKQDHVVEYLLSKNLNINRKITNKLNQYDLATLYGSKQTVELIKQTGAKPLHKRWIDKWYINPAISFNSDDVLLGVHTGIIESKSGVHLELGYKTRPWVRSVQYGVNENTFYQFWEKRSIVHLGIDKNFRIKNLPYYENLGLFVGLNWGYTYGNFRGSNKKPVDSGILIPKGGLYYQYKSFNLKFNYEYVKFNNSSVSPHRIGLAMGLMINLSKIKIKLKHEPEL